MAVVEHGDAGDFEPAVIRRLVHTVFILSAGILSGCSREGAPVAPPGSTPDSSLALLHVYTMSIGEPSGLAYCEATGTLYMISDGHPFIYRIDTTGAVLGSIPVTATDLEGITTSEQGDTLYAVEETPSLVSTFLPNGTKVRSFSVAVRTEPNHSLEGITRGPGGRLVVINEKTPTLLLEFTGSTEMARILLTATTDLSDLCYDRTDDSYWIISDESQKIIKLSRSGALLGAWSTPITQGEGIAFIGDRMYCVSDADAKLYVFRKPQ